MPRHAKPAAREKLVNFRATAAEHAHLHRQARAHGMSVSSYARTLLIEAQEVTREAEERVATRPTTASVPSAEARRLVYEINKAGVNLNQMARELNRGGMVPPLELARAIEEIRRFVREARSAAP